MSAEAALAAAPPLPPLETLYEAATGVDLPLPAALAALYGPFRRPARPARPGRPYVLGNFVATLDGVVSLGIPGQAGGGEISGFDPHDRAVMGLLRALVDAVVVGAGTVRAAPGHRWTADYIAPPFAGAYHDLRAALGKAEPPLTVVVTARGDLDLAQPVFRAGAAPVLIATTAAGARHIRAQGLPPHAHLAALAGPGPLAPRAVLAAIDRVRHCDLVLTEGGPRLLGAFIAERRLDELFLTLAPQVAGR
ncbi:MAG TPA: dihydrofolate reductase family protein, partial [Thermomicrobiales bacterium]|nr:dihydrofolate reductase family protein [Thermomicrobiales bacterium]